MGSNEQHNTALATVSMGGSLASVTRHHAALLALMAVLRKGSDYGKIPGCGDKPTLLKPGAEKILSRFGIAVSVKTLDDLSTPDYFRYRVTLAGKMRDGTEVGEGIGEASGAEEKYYWRGTNNNEWEHAPPELRRVKYKDGRNGPYEVKQVRTNPADYANTVLKIAKKRALVDLALTATAASDFYTQDVEDLPEELRDAVEAERTSTGARARGFRSQVNPDVAPPPPVDVDATVMATDDERRGVWYAFCELNEWNPESLPDGALEIFKSWVAEHASEGDAANSKRWTQDVASALMHQIQIEMTGGEPPADLDDDRIPF